MRERVMTCSKGTQVGLKPWVAVAFVRGTCALPTELAAAQIIISFNGD